MTPADQRIVADRRAGFNATQNAIAREIANVIHQRTLDGLATTVDDLATMGQWPIDVIRREFVTAQELARVDALNFGVV